MAHPSLFPSLLTGTFLKVFRLKRVLNCTLTNKAQLKFGLSWIGFKTECVV